MIIEGNTARFEAELTAQNSFGSWGLGKHTNTMEFSTIKGSDAQGFIEWVFERDGEEDAIEIGLWFENKRVTDYDGVFELPTEAITLLESLGYDCSDVVVED